MTEAAGFPGHAVVPPRALQRRCRHTKCAPTDSARSLPAVPCVPPNQRKAACGLSTAHAASRPTRVEVRGPAWSGSEAAQARGGGGSQASEGPAGSGPVQRSSNKP